MPKTQTFLFLLWIVIFLKQLLWIAFIPMWQFPDEQAHFAQVQNIAEDFQIDPTSPNTTSKEIDESEVLLGTKRDGFGNNKFTYHPEYNIAYTETVTGLHEKTIKEFPKSFRADKASIEATVYPPFYYQLGAQFYRIVYEKDLITRVFITRFVNIFIFLLLTYISYKASQLLFPRNLLLQITLVFLVGFQPMLSFVAGGVNSDNVFNLLFSAAVYLNLKILSEGWNLKKTLWGLLIIGLSLWTKPHGILVAFLFLFSIFTTKLKRKQLVLIVSAILSLVAIGINRHIVGLFENKQFLPEIPVSTVTKVSLESYMSFLINTLKQIYRQTIPWYWGVFRWLSLTYPRVVHRTVNWLSVIAVFGLVILLLKSVTKKKIIVKFSPILFLFYASFFYALGIISFDYLFTRSFGYSLGLQGRYFFPTIIAHFSLLLIGFVQLVGDTRIADFVYKSLGVAAVIFHMYSWWFVTTSYYDFSSLGLFFIQASQYKPTFFKSPMLEFLVSLGVIATLLLLWQYLRLSANKNPDEKD